VEIEICHTMDSLVIRYEWVIWERLILELFIIIYSLLDELSGYIHLNTVFFYVSEFVTIRYWIPVILPCFYNPFVGFIHLIFEWDFIYDGGSWGYNHLICHFISFFVPRDTYVGWDPHKLDFDFPWGNKVFGKLD
jgi:hypothetical protein